MRRVGHRQLRCLLVVVGFIFLCVCPQQIAQQRLVAQRNQEKILAQSYCDLVIKTAISQLGGNADFADDVVVTAQTGHVANAQGSINFKPTAAYPSVNNLSGTSTVPAGKQVLPPHCADLIAEGRYGSTIVHQEVVIGTPPFDYALASSGPLQTSGAFFWAPWTTHRSSLRD